MPYPGVTRTRVRLDHALIAPDSHVKSTLPGWSKSMMVVLISQQMGAMFSQYYANMEKGGTSGMPPPGVQRFVYVMDGAASITIGKKKAALAPGSYAYLPADCAHSISAEKSSRLLIFEKPYLEQEGIESPQPLISHEKKVQSSPFLGDADAMLKILLPEIPSFDMAINIFEYRPGATLPFVEVHIMEHGLLMLDGQGVYRLSDDWYIVGEGDAIWMAPYCAQWFVASGKTNSRYIYYKEMHRDPAVMG